MSINELEEAYSESLDLKQDHSRELVNYYRKQKGSYAKKHLEKLKTITRRRELDKKIPKAIKLYKKEHLEEPTVYAVEKMARKARQDKNIPEAIKLFKKAIEMGSLDSINDLGYIYDKEKKYEDKNKAINLYERSIKYFDPSSIHHVKDVAMYNLLNLLDHDDMLVTYLENKFRTEYENEHRIEELESENKKLRDKITHLKYMPGGLGFKRLQKRNLGKMKK